MDKWLRSNNVVKVIALMVGILLWIVVHLDINKTNVPTVTPLPGEQTIANIKIVPTHYDPNHFSVQSVDPSVVNLTLRGKQSALSKLVTSSIHVEVDLTNATAGTHSYPLKAVNIPSPLSADLLPSVQVTLEEVQKKEVPVTITIVGTPAAGYKVAEPIIKPNRVHVTLTTSQLDTVESTRAEVSVDKASDVITKQVKLTAYGKDGKPVDAVISPALVEVEIPITAPFKEMPLQITLTGQPAKGFSIASMVQSVNRLTVYGAQTILDKMEFYEGPSVDITNLKENKKVTLDVPLKSKDIRIDPNKIDVSLEVVPSTTKILGDIPLRISGINDSFTTKIISPDPPKIQVVLEGAPALLDKITAQDVQAIVDVSNLAQGKHELAINLNLPMFIYLASDQPESLKATVEITVKSAATNDVKVNNTEASTKPITNPTTEPKVSSNP
ncbi:MAG: YbbR family protein [Bacilli bacterium]|nr:YbbR family protein [Bacilli bacterium]